MHNRTLLLNASFEPLSVIPWQRALALFFMGKVEVVEEYDHPVRSISLTMSMPSVVRLLKYVKRRYFGLRFSRQNIYARDGYQCQYCTDYFSEDELSFDHVIPRSRGGKTCWENIVSCCVSCNRRKGNRTPEEAGMRLLARPNKPAAHAQVSAQLQRSQPPPNWLSYLH
ncbi:HNH endonuclease [Myxococcota bacterium]|nr:HNH endonuclease [Myxococcota bacterium]